MTEHVPELDKDKLCMAVENQPENERIVICNRSKGMGVERNRVWLGVVSRNSNIKYVSEFDGDFEVGSRAGKRGIEGAR